MPRQTLRNWTLMTFIAAGAATFAVVNIGFQALATADSSAAHAEKMQDPPRNWTYADKDDNAWKKIQSQIGKPAPMMKVKAWQNGEVSGADTGGQIVVIDFWATWCVPCIRGIPHMNELADQYGPKGVKVVGICATDGGEKMIQVVKQHKMRYPTAVDIGDATKNALSVQWFPYFVIVDRKGVVRAAGLHAERVDDVLDALLKEQPLDESKPMPRN